MADTAEKIMLTALRLFARDGYEAVSVSDIAGELGMTKGALYKHYKNKRDIFDRIVERMYRVDAESSQECGVPADDPDGVGDGAEVTEKNIADFTISRFLFWTEDSFAADFRRMLTLEQYRSSEMAELYSMCIAEGPVRYMEGIFRKMISRGCMKNDDPRHMALEFYAPFFLLVNFSDRTDDRQRLLDMLERHISEFFRSRSYKEERS